MKWYVASSWKNVDKVHEVIEKLRMAKHEVYDFTHHSIDFATMKTPTALEEKWDDRETMPESDWFKHPRIIEHYHKDLDALQTCDALVAIFPAGNSTHIEIGYVAGRSKPVYLITEKIVKDLLYLVFDKVYKSVDEFVGDFNGREKV